MKNETLLAILVTAFLEQADPSQLPVLLFVFLLLVILKDDKGEKKDKEAED